MATEAAPCQKAVNAIAEARLSVTDIDVLVLNTITGLSIPSLDAKLINRLNFHPTVERLPIFVVARLFALAKRFGCSRCSTRQDSSTSRPARRYTFVLPLFDAYYGPFERGGASTGQLMTQLSGAERHAVREEMRRALNDNGGAIAIEVEHRIASGWRKPS